jgi:hypothetical protein
MNSLVLPVRDSNETVKDVMPPVKRKNDCQQPLAHGVVPTERLHSFEAAPIRRLDAGVN